MRTSRGREVTELAYRHLGKTMSRNRTNYSDSSSAYFYILIYIDWIHRAFTKSHNGLNQGLKPLAFQLAAYLKQHTWKKTLTAYITG